MAAVRQVRWVRRWPRVYARSRAEMRELPSLERTCWSCSFRLLKAVSSFADTANRKGSEDLALSSGAEWASLEGGMPRTLQTRNY